MTKTSTDLATIKAGMEQQFSRIDQALSQLERMIEPMKPAAADGQRRNEDPWFNLSVVDGDNADLPIVIELREVAPNPKLVGFVELTRSQAFDLIDRIADRIDLNAYLSPKGRA